jgi:hypothetical protein
MFDTIATTQNLHRLDITDNVLEDIFIEDEK